MQDPLHRIERRAGDDRFVDALIPLLEPDELTVVDRVLEDSVNLRLEHGPSGARVGQADCESLLDNRLQ